MLMPDGVILIGEMNELMNVCEVGKGFQGSMFASIPVELDEKEEAVN